MKREKSAYLVCTRCDARITIQPGQEYAVKLPANCPCCFHQISHYVPMLVSPSKEQPT